MSQPAIPNTVQGQIRDLQRRLAKAEGRKAEMEEIDRDTYLRALALFTMAREHAQKATLYQNALASLFGKERHELDAFSDALYGGERWDLPFDELLRREGYFMAEPPA